MKHSWRWKVAFLIACASPRESLACGSSSGGATGISACSLEAHEEETRPKFHAGAGFSYTSTVLHFTGDRRAEQERVGAIAAFEYRPTRTLVLEVGAGPLLGGATTVGGVRYAFSPGLVSEIAASLRIVEPDGATPFVLLGAQVSSIVAGTTSRALTPESSSTYGALDLRVSAAVGWSIAKAVAPYFVARTFGGPIFWRVDGGAVSGTDLYHYQFGAGVSVTMGKQLDLFAEGVPLGERGFSAGLGLTF